MISSNRYSSFFLLFLQYVEGIGINMGAGLFGMFFPEILLKGLCPWFSKSDVIEHPVLHMMTRMFSTVLIPLGMIEYLLIRYCTTPSIASDNRSTKKYILKIFVLCMAIGDLVHTFSFLKYHLVYGLLLESSAIGNINVASGLCVARAIFLWSNYQKEKKKQKKK